MPCVARSFYPKAWDQPDLDQVAMYRAYDNLRPREGNETFCLHGKRGGLPFIVLACGRFRRRGG